MENDRRRDILAPRLTPYPRQNIWTPREGERLFRKLGLGEVAIMSEWSGARLEAARSYLKDLKPQAPK